MGQVTYRDLADTWKSEVMLAKTGLNRGVNIYAADRNAVQADIEELKRVDPDFGKHVEVFLRPVMGDLAVGHYGLPYPLPPGEDGPWWEGPPTFFPLFRWQNR